MRFLLAAALVCAGCTSSAWKPRSSECAARVDACLASCVPGQGQDNQRDVLGSNDDSRTPCQKRCEALCH